MSISRETGWTAEVTWGADALDALGADWDRLFRRCSAATPFQSRIWLSSWCRWYAPGRGRPCVVGVRYRGVLVGAAAFVLTRQKLWRVLQPAGIEQSDFCDVLIDDSGAEGTQGAEGTDSSPDSAADTPAPQAIVEHLAAAIRRKVRFDVLDVTDVRPGSVLARIRDVWPGRTLDIPGELCLAFPGVTMEQHIASLEAGKPRPRLRKLVRDLDKIGLEVRLVPAAEAEDAVDRFLKLHRLQWADRAVNSEHLTERFKAHLTTILRASTEPGQTSGFQAVLAEFSLKNKETLEVEHVASDLLLIGRSMIGGYLYGYLPSLRSRIEVYFALTSAAMALTAERGLSEFSLLRGSEQHKYRLYPTEAQNMRIVLARGIWGAAGLRAIQERTRRSARRSAGADQ